MKKILLIICALIILVGMAGCTELGRHSEDWYGTNIDLSGNVTVGGNISGSEITASGNIEAGGDIEATGDVIGEDGIFQYIYVYNNATIVGNVTADTVTANLSGYSIDVVQAYESGIAENDTMSFVFAFEPSMIVIDYSAICHHVNYPNEVGHSTGHSVIIVTGIDTITAETNYTAVCDYNGVMDSAILHSHTDVLMAAGGYDGVTYARCWGTATWDTATHTLLITFDDVQNAWDAANFFEVIATAYK